MIGLRLPKDQIARLDEWAKTNGCTRSEAIRVLIERALRRRGGC
jgi:metal-responsive CopG/Arc/MetJ family transcriptional regulator